MAVGVTLFIATMDQSPADHVAQASGSGVQGPFRASPVGPSVIDPRVAPAPAVAPGPPLERLHPGGKPELDRAKASASVVDPAAASQVSGPSTATLGVGFDAISSGQSSCGCYPPDGADAAGPNHLLAAVNTAYSIWDKTGHIAAGYPKSLGVLLTGNGCLSNISDPFAEYDAAAGRFVLGALTYDSSYNSSICIAVSRTGDPTGSWNVYGFAVSPANDLLDFPHAAIGSDAIYVTGNEYQDGRTYIGARVVAYDKAQMYAGQVAGSVAYEVGNDATGGPADTLMPSRGVTAANTMYFLSADNAGCPCSTVSVWKWTNPFAATAFTLSGGAGVTTYNQPPDAVQPNGARYGAIATNDAGNLAAYWSGGTLYGAHTIAYNPGAGTVAAIQWYQVNGIDSTPSLAQQGVIAANGQYRIYPSLAVDQSGDMTIGYAESSSSEYAGIRASGRLAGDALGSLQAETTLKVGQISVNGGRYGDYAATVVDPDGCTVWHFEEYARSGSLWGSWLGSARFAQCAGTVSPSPTATSSPAATSTPTATATSGGPTATATPTSCPPGWRKRGLC